MRDFTKNGADMLNPQCLILRRNPHPFLQALCIYALYVHISVNEKQENVWLVQNEPNVDYKAESVWVVFLYCWWLEYHCMLTPSVYSLESSLMQATLIPCQHWCHKWPHFSASYWSTRRDTALLFDVQLTNSRHCSKWSDLSLSHTHTPFSISFFLFSHLFLPCSS